MSARVERQDLLYVACPTGAAACAPGTGDAVLHLPVGVDGASITLRPLAIGAARHVLWAHAPNFDALLAAVPGKGSAVRVLWSGITGLSRGEPG